MENIQSQRSLPLSLSLSPSRTSLERRRPKETRERASLRTRPRQMSQRMQINPRAREATFSLSLSLSLSPPPNCAPPPRLRQSLFRRMHPQGTSRCCSSSDALCVFSLTRRQACFAEAGRRHRAVASRTTRVARARWYYRSWQAQTRATGTTVAHVWLSRQR